MMQIVTTFQRALLTFVMNVTLVRARAFDIQTAIAYRSNGCVRPSSRTEHADWFYVNRSDCLAMEMVHVCCCFVKECSIDTRLM